MKYASFKAATESPDHPIDTSLYFGAGLAYFDPSFTFKPDKNLKYLFDFAASQAIKSVPFNERGTSVANSTLFDDSGYNSTKQLSSGGVTKVCLYGSISAVEAPDGQEIPLLSLRNDVP